MRRERSRLLSNLIAAFIDDFQPIVPLHANGEPYTAAQPSVITSTQSPENEDSEDEGEAVQHWRADAVEIDPLPERDNDNALDDSGVSHEAPVEPAQDAPQISNLSHADAQVFYTNGELPANRDSMAAEIKQLCGTLEGHIDSFTGTRNALELSGRLFDSFLCMLTHLRREPIAIVRTSYTEAYHSDGVAARVGLRASDYTYGDVAQSPFVLIPIRKHYTATQQMCNDGVSHYMLGAFFKASGTLFHYDSLGMPASKEDKDHYRHAVNTLLPHGRINCKRVCKRPTCHYNQQDSMRLSGLYSLITAELIILRGFGRTYFKRLGNPRFAVTELQEQALRVASHLRALASAAFPCYKAPPRSQQQAPDVHHINFLMDSTRRMFRFDGNARPQIVEDPAEELTPLGRCADRHPHQGCFATNLHHKIDPFVPSGFTKKCPHCDAWLTEFEFQRGQGSNNATACKFCQDGRIATEDMRRILADYQRLPREFVDLHDPQLQATYQHFLDESRGYNAQCKFGHHNGGEEVITGGGPTVVRLNGELNFTLSDIRPGTNTRPRFGNYYALDPETAMEQRMANEDSRILGRLRPGLMNMIDGTIRRENWMANAYRTAGERLEEHMRTHDGQLPQYRVIFEKKRRGEMRDEQGNVLTNPTDIPIAEQPVVIWIDDGNQLPPEDHGIWLENRNGRGFVRYGKWDPITWPAEFPVIFPRGQYGFRPGLRPNALGAAAHADADNEDAESAAGADADDAMDIGQRDEEGNEPEAEAVDLKRGEFISMNEYVKYLLPRRGGSSFTDSPHFLWDSGSAAETAVVVFRNQIEHRQYEWHKKHQEDMGIRSMMRQEHIDFLERRMPEGTRLGKYVYMPRSIPGSKRYMQESFTKLCALESEMDDCQIGSSPAR
jgi:hypothetical protein